MESKKNPLFKVLFARLFTAFLKCAKPEQASGLYILFSFFFQAKGGIRRSNFFAYFPPQVPNRQYLAEGAHCAGFRQPTQLQLPD